MSVRYNHGSEAWLHGQCCGERREGAHFIVNVVSTADDGSSVETDAVVHIDCALIIALAQGATMGASITPDQFKAWYDAAHGATS